MKTKNLLLSRRSNGRSRYELIIALKTSSFTLAVTAASNNRPCQEKITALANHSHFRDLVNFAVDNIYFSNMIAPYKNKKDNKEMRVLPHAQNLHFYIKVI